MDDSFLYEWLDESKEESPPVETFELTLEEFTEKFREHIDRCNAQPIIDVEKLSEKDKKIIRAISNYLTLMTVQRQCAIAGDSDNLIPLYFDAEQLQFMALALSAVYGDGNPISQSVASQLRARGLVAENLRSDDDRDSNNS